MLAHLLHHIPARIGRDDVGDQMLAGVGAAAVSGEHGRLPDTRMLQQGGFDFAEFDAVSAEFDLVVGASEVFEVSVGGL
ncbi:hypothetical protein, partial [Microbispora sp. NPDC049633]|uniref:hypothetical protein n=1 Tax=Microbispora sp. NPDC049633 TaxID=3154355 RepID=UPI00344547F2